MVWVPLSLSPINSMQFMSLLELHVIKFLVPHRNLQLWPVLLFNLSVTNKTDCKSQTFHGETCFLVFIFWFFLVFSAEYEHPARIRHSCTNHPTEKQTIKKPKTKQTKKSEISSLKSYLRVIQLCYSADYSPLASAHFQSCWSPLHFM